MIRDRIDRYSTARAHNQRLASIDYDVQQAIRPPEIVTDTFEVLGDNADQLFRGHAARKTNNILEKISQAEDVKDIKTRREAFLEYRSQRTKLKIQRLEERIVTDPATTLGRWMNNSRRSRVDQLKYVQKVQAAKMSKLSKRRLERPERLQKKIDEMIKAKVDAMYRKELRRAMREQHGIGRVNFMKRTEYLAKMSADDKKRIVRDAILRVRRENISKGKLDKDYEVSATLGRREIGNGHWRTIE